jgi:hypothetical protein
MHLEPLEKLERAFLQSCGTARYHRRPYLGKGVRFDGLMTSSCESVGRPGLDPGTLGLKVGALSSTRFHEIHWCRSGNRGGPVGGLKSWLVWGFQ